MKITTIMTCHCIPVLELKLKRMTTGRVGQHMGELKTSYATRWNIKWYNVYKKPFVSFLKKLNTLSHSTCRNLSKKNEIICPHNNLTQMFTTTLFIIANNSNQSKHPTTGEWIKQAVIYPYKGILLCNERE